MDIRLEFADVQESIVVDGGVVSLGSNFPNISQTVNAGAGNLLPTRGVEQIRAPGSARAPGCRTGRRWQ